MAAYDGLPDKRWSLRGTTDEGDEAWLIRGISRKLYRCPACHGEIEIGSEHVVVQYVFRLGGTEHHHWHRRCAEELLVPDLREVKRVPASASAQSKLQERGRHPSGRRRQR
jgi:cytochrome c1